MRDSTQPQVVFGHRVADGIALPFDREAAIAQRLLDRIDAQGDTARGARQLARDRRLADGGKTVDENQPDVRQMNRLHRAPLRPERALFGTLTQLFQPPPRVNGTFTPGLVAAPHGVVQLREATMRVDTGIA